MELNYSMIRVHFLALMAAAFQTEVLHLGICHESPVE